jgi:hypothetical protein
MAATGFTPIQLYSTSTAAAVPLAANLTNSTLGSELAINITDGKLFYKDNANAVQVIGWKVTPTTAGGTGLISYTAGDTLYYASGTTLSKLAIGASTTIMTSSGSAPQWSAASGITVGTATNIAGGAAGSVPYQTGAGATSLLAIGTAYYMLGVNAGATAPSWQPSATSVLTTQGDLLYASAANTLARLAKNTTATRYLSNTGASNNPAWAQIDLSNGVTGTLPVGNGGTGLTILATGLVPYGNATSALSSATYFNFNGNKLTVPNYLKMAGAQNGNVSTLIFTRTDASWSINNETNFRIYVGSGDTDSPGTIAMQLGTSGVYSTAVGATNRAMYVDNTNFIGYLSSVRESKTNISDLTNVDWLMGLVTKQFNYRLRDKDGNYLEEFDPSIEDGLIAEEVEKINPKLCFYDDVENPVTKQIEKKLRGVHYQKLVIPLLTKVQQLCQEFDQYKATHP